MRLIPQGFSWPRSCTQLQCSTLSPHRKLSPLLPRDRTRLVSPAAEQSQGSTVPQAASACTLLGNKGAVYTHQDTHLQCCHGLQPTQSLSAGHKAGQPVWGLCDTRFVFGTAQESIGHFTQRGTPNGPSTFSAMFSDSSASPHSSAGSSCSSHSFGPCRYELFLPSGRNTEEYCPTPDLVSARLPQPLGTQGVTYW